MKRILILAQQNNPDWISVPLVGFHHSEALCLQNEVTLVTHGDNVEAIKARGLPWREVIGIHLGIWESFYNWAFRVLFKGDFGSQAVTAFRIPFYYAFEWVAWRRLKARIKRKEFDLVLRLTPVAPVSPSPFATWARKAGLPFVIGPINGGLPWPRGFAQAERQKEWISRLRQFYRYLPYARSTYENASAIVTGSSETYAEFREHRDKLFFLPENGILENRIFERQARAPGPLRLIFVGRLVPFKACDLAIRGAANVLRSGQAEFTVIGEGPEREALEKLAKDLGVPVTFAGLQPHAQTMEYFRSADVLVFPSIREFGGGVVFEALLSGCIPIVSNYGGPGDIVQEDVGFKIPLESEDQSVRVIAEILDRLARDPQLLAQMSKAGPVYARQHLSWKGKAEKMGRIFAWCLGDGPKPRLDPPR